MQTKTIYWEKLTGCPNNQLVKPTDITDAGFDIKISKTCWIRPMNKYPYKWIDKGTKEKLKAEIPELFTSLNYDLFYYQQGIRVVDKVRYQIHSDKSKEEKEKINLLPSISNLQTVLLNHSKLEIEFQYSNKEDLKLLNIKEPSHFFQMVQIKKYSPELIPTGIKVQNDELSWNAVTLRSGMCKFGISIPHSVGVIDYIYDGEIYVPVYSITNEHTILEKGDRIAQLIRIPQEKVQLEQVSKIKPTARQQAGFGSSGLI
jgi:dUTP pyrophosphatase